MSLSSITVLRYRPIRVRFISCVGYFVTGPEAETAWMTSL